MVREALFGTTYLGGDIDGPSLREAVAELRRHGRVLLDGQDPRAAHFPSDPAGEDPRLGFSGWIRDRARLEQLAHRTPSDIQVRRLDWPTFQQCLWREHLLRVFGSVEGYLRNSLGFCMASKDEVLAEAHAFFWGDREVEIGTITGEQHRGAGHATTACAALVLACQARDHRTYWGCDIGNPASVAIARKLGYPEEHGYRLIRFEATADPSPLRQQR